MGASNPSIVLLRRESFEKMLTAFTETYGTPGYSMIFSMGKKVGEEEFRNIAEEQEKLNIPMTRPKILKKALDRLTSMGWGRFQAESLELNISAIVVVTNNMFSDKCSKSSVGCCFIQGIIAGLISEVFESEPLYGEPRCLAQPGGRCVFRLSSEKAQNKLIEPTTIPSST
jgi:predicted hydrocarbon binding protein